jgi:hypothetical protein
MLHVYVQRFDVTENLKILAKFLASKWCLAKFKLAREARYLNGQHFESNQTCTKGVFYCSIFRCYLVKFVQS